MIKSKIISGILSDFQKSFNLGHLEENDAFEYLINYLIISNFHPEAFDDPSKLELVSIDKGKNFGIDGVAIIINDNLISSIEEIENHRKSKFKTTFVFTQSKTSETFDGGDLLKFIAGVKNFFLDEPNIPLNDDLSHLRKIKDALFEPENARHFSSDTPNCILYYATTGKPTTDNTINAIALKAKKEIETEFSDLKSVDIKLLDSKFIIDVHTKIENSYEATLTFEHKATITGIEDVEQAYIGYLNLEEFLKIISDKEGNLMRKLFYENVRDFQGTDNKINQEIANTITEEKLQDKFILLNNGITIVTKHYQQLRGHEILIRDYQIVNGCQTSHIVYKNRDYINNKKKLLIPIKIIHTSDNDLTSKIIKATNRQSRVPDEAFLALENFHKNLQLYYRQASKEIREDLFYERRSREYSNLDDKIERTRIISLHAQIRYFSAMFLHLPQDAQSKDPSIIYKENNSKMFVTGYKYEPYFASAYAHYKLQEFFNSGKINTDKGNKKFKYHILLYFKVRAVGRFYAQQNSVEIEKCSKVIIDFLCNDEKCKTIFMEALGTIARLRKQKKYSTNYTIDKILKSEDFTNAVVNDAVVIYSKENKNGNKIR